MRSNTKFKPPRHSVRRAACGDGVGRRAWGTCNAPWRERRRVEMIACSPGRGSGAAATVTTPIERERESIRARSSKEFIAAGWTALGKTKANAPSRPCFADEAGNAISRSRHTHPVMAQLKGVCLRSRAVASAFLRCGVGVGRWAA
jgi:hypothetical protein